MSAISKTLNTFAEDLAEALALLRVAGPNRLLIQEGEYWDRYAKLTDKYFPEENEDDDE